MRLTRVFAPLCALIATLAIAAPAQATCNTTVSSLAAVQTAVSGCSGGGTVKLTGGVYTGTLTLSTTSTSRVTVQNAAGGTAEITQGVGLQSSHLRIAADSTSGGTMEINNTSSSANGGGHCVTVQGNLTDVSLTGGTGLALFINTCYGDGIRFFKPATTAQYDTSVSITNSNISNTGTGAANSNSITIHANAPDISGNGLNNSPNDAIQAWGPNFNVHDNLFQDYTPGTSSQHPDALQTFADAGTLPLTGLTFERNRVYRFAGVDSHGITEDSTTALAGWTIRNNLFADIGGRALILGVGTGTGGLSGAKVNYNTFVRTGKSLPSSPRTIEFNQTSTGSVYDNVFYDCPNGGLHPVGGSSTGSVLKDYNEAYLGASVSSESNGLNTNPLFVNPLSDYRIQTTSPAKDSGDDGVLVTEPTTDVNNFTRSSIADRGAFEFGTPAG